MQQQKFKIQNKEQGNKQKKTFNGLLSLINKLIIDSEKSKVTFQSNLLQNIILTGVSDIDYCESFVQEALKSSFK